MSHSIVIPPQSARTNTHRPFVLASLILAMFMAAIETTIVSTAMPSIVGDLGGFSWFSWVFSAFLLMQAVMTPIYGKLSDLFGRKPIFIVGVVIFLIGSILCGFASSMTMLVVFRLIQGLGAGAVQPITLTIVGDMYTLKERAKVQGFFSSVFGISSIVGPLVGGFIVQYAHWSWIFWMNVPLGIVAMIGVSTFLHENLERTTRSVDYIGSTLFFIAISAVMVALIQGGVAWPWLSAPVLGLMVVFLVGTGLFLLRQTRAPEPMMPLGIWKNRLISSANIATMTSGALVIGLTSFLPTYIQGVMGRSAMTAGFALTVMTMGWPIAALVAGHVIIRIGIRPVVTMGAIAIFIGSIFFITLNPARGPLWASTGSFIIGIGMGLTSSTFMISIQNSVDWQMRGVATSSNMFMRLLGSCVGAALLGGVLNTQLKNYLVAHQNSASHGLSIGSVNQLLSPTGLHSLSADKLHILQSGLTLALHSVYWWVFGLAILTLVATLFLPKLHQTY